MMTGRIATVAALLFTLGGPAISEQVGGRNATFDVASIKRSSPEHAGAQIYWPNPQQFTAMTATLKDLAAFAYGVRPFQVTEGPGWCSSEPYDISAKTERAFAPDEARLMLRNLLKDRFRLEVREKQHKAVMYRLIAGRGGIHMTRVEAAGRGVGLLKNQLNGRGATMASLATALTGPLGRPVIDGTGLGGFFDFTLRWAADDAGPEAAGPSLFAAIQEQLGLRLVSSRGQVTFLVITHAQRPSGN